MKQRIFKAFCVLSGLAAVYLWTYFAFVKQSPLNLQNWEEAGCSLKGKTEYVAAKDCRHELSVATLFALPHLSYGERMTCRLAQAGESPSLPLPAGTKACAESEPKHWGGPQHLYDIGWDSYLLWTARPAALFFLSQRPEWPGLWHALGDLKFMQMFPDDEDIHYPWALTLAFFGLMKVQGSPNPFILQVACVLAALACVYLFRKTWPSAPLWLLALFAFAPVGGRFLVHVMGDVWIVLFNLLLLRALQTRRVWLGVLMAALLVHSKQEGWVHVLALCGAWFFLERKFAWQALLSCGIAFGLYKIWAAQWPVNNALYTPLSARLTDMHTYTTRFPEIARYYIDVMSRFKHWVVLWPVSLFLIIRSWRSLRWAWLPLLCFILVIPLGYVQFPDGTYREIILTGAPRSLWPILPLVWLLLSRSQLMFKQR